VVYLDFGKRGNPESETDRAIWGTPGGRGTPGREPLALELGPAVAAPPEPKPPNKQDVSKGIAMVAPRVLVLRAPGTNCDLETAYAFERAGGVAERVHVNRLIENPTLASRYQIFCIPGGFSYGDDIAAGRILASRIESHLADAIAPFTTSDRLLLGICNGMQVLMRLGILTTALNTERPAATLTWNNHGRFEDRWVHLRVDGGRCVFLRNIDRMYLPMAHAEGKFVTSSATIEATMQSQGQLALRYCGAPGSGMTQGALDQPIPFPANPNGSQANVAGICDPTGRLFGLMPHPERHIDPTHHPAWTRRKTQPEHGDGLPVFQNAVDYFR
jgi:phosphoribosylformylglycinamidine synthase subunit PurQ / glutaminase